MKAISARVAMMAFPASATVILGVAAIEGATSVDISESVAAAATGLVTWAAIVFLGAGEKNGK